MACTFAKCWSTFTMLRAARKPVGISSKLRGVSQVARSDTAWLPIERFPSCHSSSIFRQANQQLLAFFWRMKVGSLRMTVMGAPDFRLQRRRAAAVEYRSDAAAGRSASLAKSSDRNGAIRPTVSCGLARKAWRPGITTPFRGMRRLPIKRTLAVSHSGRSPP